MFHKVRTSFAIAAICAAGTALHVHGETMTVPATAPANATSPLTANQPAIDAAPVVIAPVATPATSPATQQAAAAIQQTPATEPAPYRGAVEFMPIHPASSSAVGDAVAGSQPSPSKALGTSLGQSGIGTSLQVGAALCVVVGLIFVGKAMAKKFVPGAGSSNGKNVIEILARYPLAKAQSLVMVRIGSQIVVLNQSKETSTSLLVISEPMEVANLLAQIQGGKPSSIQAGFNKLLANATMDLERGEMNEPDAVEARMQAIQVMEEENLDEQLDEMAAAKRQLTELRDQVRSIRENLR